MVSRDCPTEKSKVVIYFIHGPDRLIARQAALDMLSDVDPEGLNTTWLDGREVSLATISTAVASASFFGTPRIVIVSDLFARSSRSGGSDTNAHDSQDPSPSVPGLRSLLDAVPE